VFHHYSALVLHLVDDDGAGYDLRYRVTHQPDKYADNSTPGEATDDRPQADRIASGNTHDDDTPVTDELYAAGQTRVDHFYDLELEA
jgi:hypothetical protein